MDNLERDRIERAVRQRAYDDGYEDGRLDVNREMERDVESLRKDIKSYIESTYADWCEIDNLKDQVDYWRNEFNRVNSILALQIEQADEIRDEAWEEGYEACVARYEMDNE